MYYLILFYALLFFSCSGLEAKNDGKLYKNAVTYNDYIITRQGKIVSYILKVADMIGKDLDSAESMLSKGVMITDSALADVKKLKDFKGDTLFRIKALANFTFYRKLFTSDYREIISINKKGEASTEKDLQQLQSIQLNLENEEAELDKQLGNAQSDFAQKNKMPLLENEVQKIIDR